MEDMFLVLEGDWGGQVYLICPDQLGLSLPDHTYLDQLLTELDAIAWSCNDGDGAFWHQLPYDEGGVAGGMGGGVMIPGAVWLHGEFRNREGLEDRIRFLLHLPAEMPIVYGDDA